MSLPTEEDNISLKGEEGRLRILFEYFVIETALGDSGADFTALDIATLNKITNSNPNRQPTNFPTPSTLSGSFKTGRKDQCTAFSSMVHTVTIYIPGSKFPVSVRRIEFMIVYSPMEEVFLGRPLMNAIGLDLTDHLTRFQCIINNKNMEELEATQLKLEIEK